MPVYEYTALDAGGRQVSGIVEAESAAEARRKVRGLDRWPVDLVEADCRARAERRLPGGSRRLAAQAPLLTRRLAAMLDAGIPLTAALSGLIEQSDERGIKTVLAQLREAVSEGRSFSAALADHPRLFSPIYIGMTRAGEASGALADTLAQLADLGERRLALQSRIRAALLYPAFMAVVGIGVLILLFTVILPKITAVFAGNESALPPATLLLLAISDILRSYWLPLSAALIALPFALRRALASEAGRRSWHRLQLGLPLLGEIIKKRAAARFARALGSLVHAGVPLADALDITVGLGGNVIIDERIRSARTELEQGSALSGHFRAPALFPPLLAQMMAAGEQSGALDDMLIRAADSLERELEAKTLGLTSLIEPAMILVMGLVVGFILLAVLLPIFEMNQLAR